MSEKTLKQTPEDRLLAALNELDEPTIAAAIARLDEEIATMTAPLRKKREQLRKCQMILRGRKMRASGQLGRRRRSATNVEVAAVQPWEPAILRELKLGIAAAAEIGKRLDEPAPVILARLNELEKVGKVSRGVAGTGTWKLAKG
jgi:hypothetical protein